MHMNINGFKERDRTIFVLDPPLPCTKFLQVRNFDTRAFINLLPGYNGTRSLSRLSPAKHSASLRESRVPA